MAPTYAPSHARYAISCTPIPSWSSSKCRNTPSTNQLHVFAFQVGRSVLLNKDYCLNTCSSSSKFFRQGWNAWNLFDFDNQSVAFFLCGYHIILFHSKRSEPFTGHDLIVAFGLHAVSAAILGLQLAEPIVIVTSLLHTVYALYSLYHPCVHNSSSVPGIR